LGSLVHSRIAPPAPPVLFYVTGRLTVEGVVDLGSQLTTDPPRAGA
jgi:hypothetical protein